MSENICNSAESGSEARTRASCEEGGDRATAAFSRVSFQGITIIGKYLVHMSGRCWPLADASATVESAQSASSRLAPDRIVAGRLLLPPATDPAPAHTLSPDHLVLVVEFADQSAIVIALTPQQRLQAAYFAEQINLNR
ncbi:hypothetical protein [Rhodococcus qingshengii]|uniref:hypothetical protein n=1 Tax=Rhodococcus qingshengii TaxID=334542 RepID=UPI001C5DA407|nr:hypothetical protein [Rhodococcus qingshengii]MBW4818389.1 hypothetical protein [Rhodococcus qingshengii]